MPAPTKQTYGVMLNKLRSRLGLHATLGSALSLEDLLTEANEYVYGELDNTTPTESTLTTYASTSDYDWESDEGESIAPSSVQEVWVEQGDSSRVQLSQGITHAMRAMQTSTIPERYDTKFIDGVATLELWPVPDQSYRLYIRHNRVLQRFEQTADLPSVPQRLVFLYALSVGKAHYRQPDAQVVGQSFKTMLSTAKYNQHENRRYLPCVEKASSPYVVSTPNGFRQVG